MYYENNRIKNYKGIVHNDVDVMRISYNRKQEWIRQGKLVDDEKEPDISDDDDDVEWYRKEVGVAPDSGKYY